VQQAFFPAAAPAIGVGVGEGVSVGAVAAAAPALYAWLSSQNDRGRTAVYSFSKTEFEPGTKDTPKIVRVDRLTEEELRHACPRYQEVQEITDEAAADARSDRNDRSPQGFGTEVHTQVARQVNGTEPGTDRPRSPDDPRDPDFRAEFSAHKKAVADVNNPPARYARRNTVRVDVLENVKDGTVCVYDIKTGERTLLPVRMEEIARSVYRHYPNARRFIVTEVRPKL